MNKPDEKVSIILEIISLCLVLVSTVLIQIADYNINKFNEDLTLRMLATLNTHSLKSERTLIANFYTVFQAINFDTVTINKDAYKLDIYDDEEKALIKRLVDESISIKEFFEEYAALNKMKAKSYQKKFNQRVSHLNKKLEKGTIWLPIRNFVFIPFQVFFILVLFFGYFRLLRSGKFK